MVAELKSRESEARAAALHARMLKDTHSKGRRAANPPNIKPKMTPDDVNKQWARAVAKKGLSLSFVELRCCWLSTKLLSVAIAISTERHGTTETAI